MKLKSQLIISILVFGIVLLVISASVVITNQQVAQVSDVAQSAQNVETGASNLAYLSNDYFQNKQSSQLTVWQNQFSSVSNELSQINPSSPRLTELTNNVQSDIQQLGTVFNSSAAYLQSIPANESGIVHPLLKTYTTRLNLQNQALAFDASVLTKALTDQVDQLRQTNSLLIFVLLGAFGAYFVTVYFISYRRTFRSIAKLQEDTKIIGSGNLNYSISPHSNDEIGDLSRAFNQMTTNLKTVTASKVDLEQAQASLRESEQRWETTLASIGDAVIATDIDGNITFMNNISEALTGWSSEDAVNKHLQEVFHIINEHTRQEVENPVTKVLKNGTVVGLANHSILINKEGVELPIDDSGSPIRDQKGHITGVVLVFQDISERKQNEKELELHRKHLEKLVEERTKQLKDTERLATIGATAGMVGHDIRNPLQAITSDVYLAKTELAALQESEETKNAIESLDEIEKNIGYINKIVADLQDYARPITPAAKETDLEAICEEVLLKSDLPKTIKSSCKVDKAAKQVLADPELLRRVISNLVANAVQAMPKGGKLSINAYREEDNVVIEVLDTGVGIPEEVKPKLFTPLFTTKSKGQGFGLAVVKRVTESMNGTVSFESEQGKRTTFILRFPSQRAKR